MRKFLLGIVICLCLSVVVYAHPGRTDSNGGHTDHDTDEYHYHHGYSAHQHSDIDGDGVLDCPFNFDDKTDSYNRENATASDIEETYEKQREATYSGKKRSAIWDFIFPILCCFALYGVILLVDEIKWRLRK